jgi:hypothetical protein
MAIDFLSPSEQRSKAATKPHEDRPSPPWGRGRAGSPRVRLYRPALAPLGAGIETHLRLRVVYGLCFQLLCIGV